MGKLKGKACSRILGGGVGWGVVWGKVLNKVKGVRVCQLSSIKGY